jgi:adenylosuccinate lyase
VQSCAMQAWNKETGNFYNLICENETIKKLIKPDDLKDLFDTQKDLKFIDHTLKNLGLE